MRKIHFTFILVFCCFIGISLKAQINEGGTPPSFNIKNLGLAPFIIMPSIDLASLNAEDVVNDLTKDIPWRFGENLYTYLNPDNSGIWDVLDDGSKIWRLGISCKGAFSINLAFNKYHLPKGAKLYIYNENKDFVIGAFTDYNNQEDGMFASTLIPGESIVIEYYEPVNVQFKGELNLWRVTHAYRGPYSNLKGFGTSGNCQRNAVCSEGEGWENQIKGECMLVTGGNGFCSGTLINNTSNDGTPYIMTANHCYSDPSTWVFWFNWKSENCTPNTPSVPPIHNDISGATFKARNSATDFCLVQMNSLPPVNYNIYYVGWSRSTTPATSAMCIHHPDCDITKISRSTTLVDTFAYYKDSWKATWAYGQCTEHGSSGAPIYDQDHRFVGQLFGGPSYCSAPTLDLWDVFGKFSTSWEGGGTSSTRLKDWLDPTNIDPPTWDGYDPLSISPNKQKNNTFINIFPNPNNGIFTLNFFTSEKEQVNISIINVLGLKLFNTNIIVLPKFHTTTLDLSNLSKGLYYIIFNNNEETITKPILIQ